MYGRHKMQKYNYQLDLITQNSNSQIIKHISAGTDVLEFGPAFGRLTRYLHERLMCNVDIVELDEESGYAAACFARTACLGMEEGDIEKYVWESKLKTRKYDYIVFADVLEHLKHPDIVLQRCKAYLKEEGSILCAIPNIAHSSILISLWNNDFTYNKVGLLDDTHIHFFTRKTFEKMVQREKYDIALIEEVTSSVGNNEIPWSYSQVPAIVAHELHMREEGEIYQYIFQLKRKNNEDIPSECIRNYGNSSGYRCTCFIKEIMDADFCEGKSIRKKFNSSRIDMYFDFTVFTQINGVCVDLIEAASIIKISKVELDGKLQEFQTSGLCMGNGLYIFPEKSQIFIVVSPSNRSLHIEYEILLVNHPLLININERTKCYDQLLNEKERELKELKQKLNEVIEGLESLQKLATDANSLEGQNSTKQCNI